jgi:hypothetical protein
MEAAMGESEIPVHHCNGGRRGIWCGAVATVVCTSTRADDGPAGLVEAFPELDLSGLGPLQWYACDNPDHQEDAKIEPFAEWYRREVLEPHP